MTARYASGEVRTRWRSLLFSGEPIPGPGSEVFVRVFVRVKDRTDTPKYVALVGAVAQILASTIAIIVVIRRP